MSFLGLAPIFQTVRSHLSTVGKRNKPVALDSVRTYLECRKQAFMGTLPTEGDLGSLFEYELHRTTFGFLFEFLERHATDPDSLESAASSHSEENVPEGLPVDDNDEPCDLNDPVHSLSNDGKGLKHQEVEDEMEDESEDEDDKVQDNSDHVYGLSNDGKGLKDQEGEEEMEDESGDDKVQDNKGDLLSRHLVTDAISLDSTHQPI